LKGGKMSLKEKIQAITEKNAVKSTMSWTDSKGDTHIEEVIFKRSRLPLIGDWTRIYPVINESGRWNFINLIFGGRKNLIKLLIVFGIVVVVGLGYWELLKNIETLKDSCLNWIPNFKP